MTYVLKITKEENVLNQIRIGFWGSDNEIPATFCPDWDSAIQWARPNNGSWSAKMTADGRFYRKKDAQAALHTLEKAAMAGGFYLKGKTGADVYGLTARIFKA